MYVCAYIELYYIESYLTVGMVGVSILKCIFKEGPHSPFAATTDGCGPPKERPVETGAPDAPIDTQHYRSYKAWWRDQGIPPKCPKNSGLGMILICPDDSSSLVDWLVEWSMNSSCLITTWCAEKSAILFFFWIFGCPKRSSTPWVETN